MTLPLKKKLLKTAAISSLTLVVLVLLVFLLPILFPQTVTKKIKDWANGSINGKLEFSATGLSFFKHFPALTLTLYDVDLKGSAPFENDTLVAVKEIALGIDLSSVFKSKITIDKIYLTNALINIQADSTGRSNYNVYKGKDTKAETSTDTVGASLGIKQILIEKSRLVYNDRSIPVLINAKGVNYTGSGDLSKDVFDLRTHAEIQSLDFYYNKQAYIVSKKVNADLITKINTKSLEFIFQKNDLFINQLPVEFKGRFAFLKNGYDMDFKINSNQSDLSDIFTALPAKYQKLVDQTDVDGTGNLQLQLAGKYIVSQKMMPDINLSFKIRDGYISHQKVPEPIKHLFLNLEAKVPGLNPDSLSLNIDSLYFNIGRDKFSSIVRVKGLSTPDIYARVNTEMDLEKWNKAIGVKPFYIKGRCAFHLLAQGKYANGMVKGKKGRVDTVITSIPNFMVTSSLTNGYFKYASLPKAIENMAFNLEAKCTDNNYKHISLAMDNINATVLNDYIKGYFKLGNTEDFPVDAQLKAKFELADLQQFYPIDSLNLKGAVFADVTTKGKYIPAKKIFPVTKADISLQNGSIKTKYYPHPIQSIQVSAGIVNTKGSLKGLKVDIKPISFRFEDQPFTFKADLRNFEDLDYQVTSKGTVDIGKIYQVFGRNGYNIKGLIATNLTLRGKQSDAASGKYGRLFNSGTLKLKDVALSADFLPMPFLIKSGVFSFNQDTMRFDAFNANYGSSKIVMNGALSNVINYATKPGAVLKGNFDLTSSLLVADDFMAFAGNSAPAKSSATTGVIVVPRNLDLSFNADVKKVIYNGLHIKDAKGQMDIKNGNLMLKQAAFKLIDAPVAMDATYTNTSATRAYFNYHIKAHDFDIKKAYQQVKLFHDMATSAANAEGIVSLDYQLSGKLNADMAPVYPSLKGGGVLSVKAVKMHGFKLFGAISQSTKKDSIAKNTDVSKVDIKTSIANNIITIEQTKMRMAGFRARFGGQVGFDKSLNLNFRLGLPPLGIIGIPMTITGTQDKPKIHLGKGKQEDELKATTDDSN